MQQVPCRALDADRAVVRVLSYNYDTSQTVSDA